MTERGIERCRRWPPIQKITNRIHFLNSIYFRSKLMKNIIQATILNGKFRAENVLLPRIPMIPTGVPIEFKRVQFPIRLAFAMTINKSQGQAISVCCLDLGTPCFSHGQYCWFLNSCMSMSKWLFAVLEGYAGRCKLRINSESI